CAMATSHGPLKTSLPAPATPALPSVIRSLPSGLNLSTWLPLPSLICASVTQTLPSRSMVMPCALTICPCPKPFTTFPDGSKRRIGGSDRWKTHMSPFDAGSTEMTPPHFAAAGSFAQFASSRYGFGTLPPWAAIVAAAAVRTRRAPATIDFTERGCGIRSSRELRGEPADCSAEPAVAPRPALGLLRPVHARDDADEEIEANRLAL